LARELTALSLLERERKYEELHGVARVVDETPDFVEERLQALDQELTRIPQTQKAAYLRAWCVSNVPMWNAKPFDYCFYGPISFNPPQPRRDWYSLWKRNWKFLGPIP
jgi:hypothetical protein